MRFRRFFSLSGFGGREHIPQARMLQFIIWSLLIVFNTQGLVFFILMPQNWVRWLAVVLTLDFTLPLLLLLNHRGRSRLAGGLLLVALWFLTTVLAVTGGGIHAPIIIAYVVDMVIAGLLFGGEGGVMAGLAFCITGLVLVLLEITGHLPESRAVRTSIAMWVSLTIFLELSTIFQILANRWIKAALQQAKREMDRRQQAETALRQSRDELEVRVQERTAELRKANKELEAFSYSISHDLRSPLRTVIGFTDILLSDHARDLPGDDQNFLAKIKNSALRMNQLVEDLLKLSSLDRQPMALHAVNLTALASQTITELRAEHPDRNLDFRLADLPECLADPVLVRQVFFNLLANAVKFTGTRPVALIEIGFKTEEGEMIYFVRDNGVGFDMQYAGKLFGDFQRLHSPKQFPGTGVGLSLVRRIIERHHGRVWAESAVDKGATFYFTLPGPDQKPQAGEGVDALEGGGGVVQIFESLSLFPFWAVFLVAAALALLSVGAGLWMGKYQGRRSEATKQMALGELVQATSGLLVFMLGFTFSLAASRFDARRMVVLDEANAIGTAYLRAGLLADPYRAETRRLLRQYVEVRLKAVQSGKIQVGIPLAEEIQSRLWDEAEAAGGKNPGSIVVGLFISSLNDVIDLHSKRVMLGLRNHIPTSIWAALLFLEVCAMGVMGYHSGLKGAPRLPAIIPMALAFSVVLLLIVDLDRPQEGLLKVSQQPLTDLLKNFDRADE